MRPTAALWAVLAALLAGDGLAQEEPLRPALELPEGARVRLRTQASSDHWIRGLLTSADTGTIALVPDETPPLGASVLRLPTSSVTRLEVLTGKKRQWLIGLLVGAALGVTMGVTEPVDAERCQVDPNTFCSRGGAVAAMTGTSAALGALVGNLVKKDVWTPVAVDALGPPRTRRTPVGLGIRALPGGVGAQVSVSF